MLWDFSPEDLARGFAEKEEACICALCGRIFEKGRIYEINKELYDAFGAVKRHIAGQHGNTADFLLAQRTELTGISEVQQSLLQLMSEGAGDKQIALKLGIALSTVRNHRLRLREKEKQARLFLAMMDALEKKTSRSVERSDDGMLEEVHAAATMLDERYSITPQEREKTVHTYMDENGALKQFPAREKKKIIVLREIMKNFKPDTEYSKKEVNRILMRIYEPDYPTVRRYLIEYGFMERSRDGSVYRVKEF